MDAYTRRLGERVKLLAEKVGKLEEEVKEAKNNGASVNQLSALHDNFVEMAETLKTFDARINQKNEITRERVVELFKGSGNGIKQTDQSRVIFSKLEALEDRLRTLEGGGDA